MLWTYLLIRTKVCPRHELSSLVNEDSEVVEVVEQEVGSPHTLWASFKGLISANGIRWPKSEDATHSSVNVSEGKLRELEGSSLDVIDDKVWKGTYKTIMWRMRRDELWKDYLYWHAQWRVRGNRCHSFATFHTLAVSNWSPFPSRATNFRVRDVTSPPSAANQKLQRQSIYSGSQRDS